MGLSPVGKGDAICGDSPVKGQSPVGKGDAVFGDGPVKGQSPERGRVKYGDT